MSSISIQTSLSRWFAVQTLVGLSFVCIAVYAATRWSFQLKQSEEFVRYAELVQHVVEETSDPPNLDALRHKLGDYFLSHPDAAATVWVGETQVYLSSKASADGSWIARTRTLDGLAMNGQPIRLQLILDVSGDDLLLRRLAWTLVSATMLGSLLVAFTGSLVVRRGLRQLKVLALQTAEAGPERPGVRIQSSAYANELQPWIGQFNALLVRVEGAYEQLESFNADVAHELRTPLANMIAQAEVELSQARSVAALQDALSSQLEEAHRLSGVITDMLFLSKADRGARARRAAPVSIAEQVSAVAEFHEAELEAAELTLRIDGDAVLPVDVGLLRRAVSNLFSNAIRYATPQSMIRVSIDRERNMVRLFVDNRGEAIADSALPHLFERFYRADRSRSGSSVHHGLGLTIVAAIARMHGGSTFASSDRGVTRIGLVLADPESTSV